MDKIKRKIKKEKSKLEKQIKNLKKYYSITLVYDHCEMFDIIFTMIESYGPIDISNEYKNNDFEYELYLSIYNDFIIEIEQDKKNLFKDIQKIHEIIEMHKYQVSVKRLKILSPQSKPLSMVLSNHYLL
jgi:hypothetical protein